MSTNRVQKLLFSEYCDFEDMVLIESPFAQTTRDGKGIRQVHLGLTPTKLVLATDVLPPVENACTGYLPGIDPEIETFELIAIYPVECVNLSIFRRKRRQALKAHFCNNRVLFFELGGFEKRNMFWNLWREKVNFLSPNDPGQSHSETSVATSTSNSTLYLVDSKQVVRPNGSKQLWCRFATGNSQPNVVRRWTDRNLYMGKSFEDNSFTYKPVTSFPISTEFVSPINQIENPSRGKLSTASGAANNAKDICVGDCLHINRFACGIKEGCQTGLYLLDNNDVQVQQVYKSEIYGSPSFTNDMINYAELAENAVRLWELYKETDPNLYNTKHRRRYGFCPHPLFLCGLGPWSVSSGARYSIQIKRAVSMVSIRRQNDKELKLQLSKRQLIATISCEALNTSYNFDNKIYSNASGPKKPVIYFWTPDYWYRPRTAKEAYLELQVHLCKIRENLRTSKETNKRSLFRRRYKREKELILSSDSYESDMESSEKKCKTKLFGLFTYNSSSKDEETTYPTEKSMRHLRDVLRLDMVLTAWDFDSTTIAEQLTMIDRDLFLKISPIELKILTWQQSTKNAPNIASLIAFSHRISCMVSTEVLRDDSEKARARLVARFINAADKCHRMSNFQSCRTILTGLQSPAVYRLKLTWAYVRKKHATKYLAFETLCRVYRDPRCYVYQKAFFIASQTTPYMPFIGDVIYKLLDRIPIHKPPILNRNFKSFSSLGTLSSSSSSKSSSQVNEITGQPSSSVFIKLFKNLRIWKGNPKEEDAKIPVMAKSSKIVKCTRWKPLCEYYKPLYIIEDNRSKCLGDTIEFLERSQLGAMTYVFGRNELCSDYLLKSRYKEDRESFFNSLSVEPSEVTFNWHFYNKS